jgi:O-antigen/teichoic acid export membrane protein
MARTPERAQRLLAQALSWKLMLAGPLFLVVALSAQRIAGDERSLQAVYLMTAAHILRSIKDGLRAPLLAEERFDLEALSVTLERFCLLLAGAGVLWSGGGLLGLCAAFVAVRSLDVLVLAILVDRSTCPVRLGFEMGKLRSMILAAAPIGLFYATLTLYNYVDTVMIKALQGDVQVGLYNAAYRIYEGALMLPSVVSMVLMPRLSVAAHAMAGGQASEAFRALLARGIKYAAVLGSVIGAFGLAVARPIMELSFGEAYQGASPALFVLMLGLAPVFALNMVQTVLITLDRQRTLVIAALCGLLLNAALNWLLIPIYGFVAAASVTVGVETAVLLALLAGLRRWAGVAVWIRVLLRPIAVVSSITLLVCWLLPATAPILRVAALAVTLPLALLLTGHLTATERSAIRAFVSRGPAND